MNKQGFTLIELLVVISVIAILVGIAIPRFKGMQDEANLTKAKSELRVLQTAIESYYMNQSNSYPATSTTVAASTLNSTTPLIIGEPLLDPFESATEYNYILSSNGTYYVAMSTGADGAADIRN
jgi:type II secretion system protein G